MLRLCIFLLTLVMLPLLAFAEAPDTARLIVKLYRAAGPRIGVTFVEPSVVLTLGGMKAHNDGWASISDPEPADARRLLTLSEDLKSQGIRLQPIDMIEEEQRFHVSVTSLPGLRRCLQRSTLLAGVTAPAENTAQSWRECTEQIHQLCAAKYPGTAGQFLPRLFLDGLTDEGLGDDYQNRQHEQAELKTILPEMGDYFDGPQPLLSVSPRLSHDPQLLAQQQEWGQFLQEVYASPEFRQLAAEPAFLAARRRKIEGHAAWLKEYRDLDLGIQSSPETVRLGIFRS
ncbi:hypothetical protein JST97_06090 [bacterium]|nr:hypothetical protein [bacterium]